MKTAAAILALVLITMVVACDRTEPEPDLPPISASEISAETLWQRITEEAPYTNYGSWPEHPGENPGQSPHGVVHRIFVNRTLLEAIPIAGRVAPDGSIIAKDNLNAARELGSITVMAKVAGYDPENGDWFWANYAPDGTVRAAGSVSTCIVCHEGVIDNDYVILRGLNAPIASD